jgi:Ca2+-binding RTX toxin-like protein
MVKNVIDYNSATTIDISTPGEEWLVQRDVLVRTAGDGIHGIHETSVASASRIQVNGFVASDGSGAFALYSQGADSAITIGKSGVLTSTATALRAEGSGVDIHNLGRISGTSDGVSMSGEQQTLTNSGVIGSYDAVKVTGGFNTIINEKSGIIDGYHSTGTAGSGIVVLLSATGETTKIVNRGEISGGAYAVYGEIGNEVVINRGLITGFVFLGEGADRFDNRKGTMDGLADGGQGDDLYILDDTQTDIREQFNFGTDTVKASVNHTLDDNFEVLILTGRKDIDGAGNALANDVVGNRGANTLRGEAGADSLAGGKGKDRLFGGSDSDVFVFGTGDGHDTIVDFQNGLDQIGVGSWKAIKNAQDLIDNHARDTRAGLLIQAGNDSLLLKGFSKSDLDVSDITFVI